MPAIGTIYPMTFTFADWSGETSAVTIFTSQADTDTLADLETKSDTLLAAIEGVSQGLLRKRDFGQTINVTTQNAPDKTAQRELKLLLTMRGFVTEKLYTVSIPVVDPDALNFGVGDDVLIASGASAAVTALVNAINANARAGEPSGEALTVIRARLVGRNI